MDYFWGWVSQKSELFLFYQSILVGVNLHSDKRGIKRLFIANLRGFLEMIKCLGESELGRERAKGQLIFQELCPTNV